MAWKYWQRNLQRKCQLCDSAVASRRIFFSFFPPEDISKAAAYKSTCRRSSGEEETSARGHADATCYS
jgi:hypothetical protein